MGIALLGSMMLFGCRKIGETAPETASAGTSYVSEETAGESKTETKATEPPVPTEDPAPEPLVPEAIEPTPAEDALPEGMVKSYLTGEPVAEVQGRRRPVAVMLSNIISACPQSGISRAGVIYEAPVEGGITRLMGLFENYDISKRSDRCGAAANIMCIWQRDLTLCITTMDRRRMRFRCSNRIT